MNYFVYHRKSTDEPDNQMQSLETQKRITDSIQTHNYLVVVDSFAEAISAKVAGKRPLFTQMIERIRKGEADGILVAHLDRLTRNGTESAQIINLFEFGLLKEIRTGSKIYNCVEDILYMDFDFAFAAHFSRQLSKKVKEGMETKRLKGEYTNRAPIGYFNRDARIYPDPVYAPFIKQIFALYQTGQYSIKHIAENMYLAGLRTRDTNNKVAVSTIHEILRNPTYYGVIRSRGKLYKGIHEPLISKETFDTVQLRISGKSLPRGHRLAFRYRGLLVCGVCGCAMTATIKKGRYVYYYCTNGKHICDQHLRYLSEDRVHELLRDSISAISLPSGFVELAYSTYADAIRQQAADGTTVGVQVQSQLKSVEDKIERLLDLYLDKKIDSQSYEAKKMQLTNEKVELELQYQRMKQQNPERTLELVKNVLDYACSFNDLFEKGTDAIRGNLLKSVLWNVSVKDGEILSEQYKKPYEYLKNLSKTTDLKTLYPVPDSNRRFVP